MGSHIFVCYAREDKEFVLALATELKGRDLPVWIDLWDISPGADWDRSINAALQSCTHFLIVLSPTSVASNEVRGELRTALNERKHVVPVLYKKCEIPRQLQVIEYADFTSSSANNRVAIDQITKALGSSGPNDGGRLIHAPETAAGKLRRWQRQTLLSLAAGVLVLLFATVLIFRQLQVPENRDVPPPYEAEGAGTYYSRGTEFLQRGDYNLAISEFDKAIALGHGAESYYNRGLAFFSMQDLDSAIADWDEAIKLDSKDARAYRQRANAYAMKPDYGLAFADYNRAIELDPQNSKAYYNRGELFRQNSETAKAREDFAMVLTMRNDPEVEREARRRLAELDDAVKSGQ